MVKYSRSKIPICGLDREELLKRICIHMHIYASMTDATTWMHIRRAICGIFRCHIYATNTHQGIALFFLYAANG